MYEHLTLPEYIGNIERRKPPGGGGYTKPDDRNLDSYYETTIDNASKITDSYKKLKTKYKDNVDPNLIFKLKINQSVGIKNIEEILNRMNIDIITIAENKKGYWVIFSKDEDLRDFKNKLAQYSGKVAGAKYDFFNAIDCIEDIPIEEKLSEELKEKYLTDKKPEFLNIELWRMENDKLENFIKQISNLYSRELFNITDKLITNSFALIRAKITKQVLDEIIEFKEICRVERPYIPVFNPYEYREVDIEEFEINPPNDNAAGILVIDSGIVSNHPLLEKSVSDEQNFQDNEKELHDTVGHGTAVSGFAVYGDIENCFETKQFNASNWLFSAKIMYKEQLFNGKCIAQYDPEKLLENQLLECIQYYLGQPRYKIKVVNLSIGDGNNIWNNPHTRQFPLASLIDEIAFEYPDIVFVISAGNCHPGDVYSNIEEITENYPNYFVKNPKFKIINPATSALSFTVGSIAPEVKIAKNSYTDEDIWLPIAQKNQPSPFTRCGFGINGMVKPELVEYGGNIILSNQLGGKGVRENVGGYILSLANNPHEQLFTFGFGTSIAAPKIANLIGKIANKYPNQSSNFIKNIVLQSSEYPLITTDNGKEEIFKFSDDKDAAIKTLGYGLPSYDKAVYSFDKRVLLFDESDIGLNKIKIFSLDIPSEFMKTQGYKRISIALTFNPPTRSSRGDSYIGNSLEFKLFHSINPDEIKSKFSISDILNNQDTTPPKLKGVEIDLTPSVNKRKVSCHQKGVKEFKKATKKDYNSPFSIVLINQNKWIKDEEYMQAYCLSVVFEHEKDINIYNKLKLQVQKRIRTKYKV